VSSNGNCRRLDPSSLILTSRPHTQHCQFANFWPNNAFLCFRRLLVLQICHLVIFLVPQIKLQSQGLSFSNIDRVQKAIKTLTETDFQSCYEAWKIRWAKCVVLQGCYFEGDCWFKQKIE
jgi:hypothetical protein